MCIAIYKPQGVAIPSSHLEESFFSNPDGAGFAVAFAERLIVRKGFFDLESFCEAFAPYENDAALVHFRIATSGGVNPEMCHPFLLAGGKYALIHNGIFSINHDKTKESDTSLFCREVLSPILECGVPLDSPALRYLVEEAIGRFNKLAIMDRFGKVVIFNEEEGNVRESIWYSNYGYLPPRAVSISWKQTPKLLTAEKETVHCWYCGSPFLSENIEDFLCPTCDEKEEAQYFTSYKRK